MPREIITTNYTDSEFKELLKSIISEAVKEEIDRVLDRPNNPFPHKEFLSIRETAEMLGISLVTLHNRLNEGVLPRRRVGRKVFIKWEDVQKALRTYDEKRAEKLDGRVQLRPAKRM